MGEIECPYCGQILPEGSGRPELKLHVETVHPCIKKGWYGRNLWPIPAGEEEEDEVGEDGEEEGEQAMMVKTVQWMLKKLPRETIGIGEMLCSGFLACFAGLS